MSKLIKYYSIVNGTIINLKGCSVLQNVIPKSDDIVKAIREGSIPLYIYTEDILWEKIRKEVQLKAANKLGFPTLPIFIGSVNTKPVCLIGTKNALQIHQEMKEKQKENKVKRAEVVDNLKEERKQDIEKYKPNQLEIDKANKEIKGLKKELKKTKKLEKEIIKLEEENA